MASEAKLLMVQFLEWIAARPRSIGEVRAAWSSTCPLNCAWEDALCDDLVACSRDGRISLTARGRERLTRVLQP
ncbi:MAG TPA: hypothetical protein VMB84_08100 [Stellaceae bacterium]|nr:hypothetical protein [Stellaceae bacterium]